MVTGPALSRSDNVNFAKSMSRRANAWLKHRGGGGIEAGIMNIFPAPAVQKIFRGNQAAGVGPMFEIKGMYWIELLLWFKPATDGP